MFSLVIKHFFYLNIIPKLLLNVKNVLQISNVLNTATLRLLRHSEQKLGLKAITRDVT